MISGTLLKKNLAKVPKIPGSRISTHIKRYIQEPNNKVIMASEVGVLEVDSKDVLIKGRLQPGKMFLIDLEKKKIVENDQ